MRYVRLLLPLVLLFAAVPAFAVCGYCNESNSCVWSRGLGTRCYYEHYICYSLCVEEGSSNCNPSLAAAPASFGTEFRILSVKVEEARAVPAKQESAVIPAKKTKT